MDILDELMGCNNDDHDLFKTKIPDLESMTATAKKALNLKEFFHEGNKGQAEQ